jgi:uncharacterized protein DUF3800
MSSSDPPPFHYIAFIDEAGDPGITRVRPIDANGASEWLVIGCVLIQACREAKPVLWVRDMLDSVGMRQRKSLHFRELDEWRKPLVCQNLATRPVRLFALTSNKKNMRGHTNPRAEAKGNPLTPRQYFYNFCLRLMLERVTDFCYHHSLRHHGKPRHLKIMFSERGGQNYGHLLAYQELLKVQSRGETTFLDKRTIKWQVVDRRLMEALPHVQHAGLQLADIVASSFYQATDILHPTVWDPRNAQLLKPRIAKECGFYIDYGVTFQPSTPHLARLLPKQKEIFEFYGYDGRDF